MFCLQCRAIPSVLRAIRPQSFRLPSQTLTSSASSPLRTLSHPTLTQRLLPTSLTPVSSLPQQTRSFSASASLAGRRATYNPSRRVQKRRHGFLARLRSRGGRKILLHRRAKGRKALSW